MAEPDPSGVEPGESWPNSVLFYTWPCGNKRNRKARAQRIMQNARRGGGEWSCRECGDPVPFTRRADAVFCREGCRKKAARRRRAFPG